MCIICSLYVSCTCVLSLPSWNGKERALKILNAFHEDVGKVTSSLRKGPFLLCIKLLNPISLSLAIPQTRLATFQMYAEQCSLPVWTTAH